MQASSHILRVINPASLSLYNNATGPLPGSNQLRATDTFIIELFSVNVTLIGTLKMDKNALKLAIIPFRGPAMGLHGSP